MNKIFNIDQLSISDAIEKLQIELNKIVPYVSIKKACLGNDTIMLCVSFDLKETWRNGYLENSNYFRISIEENGVIEQFVCGLYQKGSFISFDNRLNMKFRKATVKSFDSAVMKIVQYCNNINQYYNS